MGFALAKRVRKAYSSFRFRQSTGREAATLHLSLSHIGTPPNSSMDHRFLLVDGRRQEPKEPTSGGSVPFCGGSPQEPSNGKQKGRATDKNWSEAFVLLQAAHDGAPPALTLTKCIVALHEGGAGSTLCMDYASKGGDSVGMPGLLESRSPLAPLAGVFTRRDLAGRWWPPGSIKQAGSVVGNYRSRVLYVGRFALPQIKGYIGVSLYLGTPVHSGYVCI